MGSVKAIEVGLDIVPAEPDGFAHGVAIFLPNNTIAGRFYLHAFIVDGPKAMLDRRALIMLTKQEAEVTRDGLASALIKYPRTGMAVDAHRSGR